MLLGNWSLHLLSPSCFVWVWIQNDRIIESWRLEKTSKIIKSNHQPITTMSWSAISTRFLNTSRNGDSTTFLGSLFQRLYYSFNKEIFPNIQSKPPLTQFEAIASHSITCYLGEETNTHLNTTVCQLVVESNKVFLQPPLLQTKQSQFPQSLLIRLVL